MNQTQKFETIIESYLNGNISWVKDQVKKFTKYNRKELYQYFHYVYPERKDDNFFFELI